MGRFVDVVDFLLWVLLFLSVVVVLFIVMALVVEILEVL